MSLSQEEPKLVTEFLQSMIEKISTGEYAVVTCSMDKDIHKVYDEKTGTYDYKDSGRRVFCITYHQPPIEID